MQGRIPLVALVILDGWGLAPPGRGNAVSLARTPAFDALRARHPMVELRASGTAVGLPDGQMGNSEVGHLTIGSGRILLQDLQRVNEAVRDGSLFRNEVLAGTFRRARERGGDVHLLGLVSSGGVHSHIDHLRALLELSRLLGMESQTWVHAFTDGRDVSPHAAADDLATLPAGRIATVAGRYYAMDRDSRWERTERALAAICSEMTPAADPLEAIRRSYAAGITDEFVEPVAIVGRPRLRPGLDAAICFNFRPDRMRQLARLLLDRGTDLTTMTRYAEDLSAAIVFPEQRVEETLAEVLSRHGLRQLHAAETEKYAHVTYFFNGGQEREWPGETRLLVPSRRDVASYDLAPAMSAAEVADRVCAEVGDGYAFCVVNVANPDMVGHTGSIPAAVAAVEATDAALGRVVEAVQAAGGICLVTADHGNAETMLAADGVSPHTAHTTNPVPLLATLPGASPRAGGELRDLAPTVLALLGRPVPAEMTGSPLLLPAARDHR